MTTDAGPPARTRTDRVARAVVVAYAVVVAITALVLWWQQTVATATPCSVPSCTWPRLSAEGFASLAALGLPAWSWVAVSATLSAVCIVASFVLGVVVARSPGSPIVLAVLWFTFALGPVSAVIGGPGGAVLRLVTVTAWFTLFALFPSAHFRPRWVAAAPVVAALWSVVLLLPPVSAREAASDPLWWGLEAGGYLVCVGVIVAAQILQFRRGDAATRRQIGLLLVVFGVFVLFAIVNGLIDLRLGPSITGYGTLVGGLLYELSSLMTLLLIACVAIAMIRDGAYGTRVVVDRALVAAIALLGAGIVYAVTVAIASAVLHGPLTSALAAVVTAFALAGTYARISRAVGRLVYGDADDPATVAAALDARLADIDDPAQLLPAIADTLVMRLRLPGIRVVAVDGADAIAGALTGRTTLVPLSIEGRPLGTVEVALRSGRRRLTARDRAAIAAASGPLATALTARRLTEEVRRSRLDVLIGRDDERRALRRRLHDEVGPTLALAGHRIEAARTDPARWDAAARTVQDALTQVRSISRDLRPPALDDLGLGPALSALGAELGPEVSVSGGGRVPGVVEVALYRIGAEALVNATRHGQARVVRIAIDAGPATCELIVDDDGVGMPAEVVPGVGFFSMRERATELGGTLEWSASPLGGVRIHARVPIPKEST